jgi:hypothetical protein
VPLAALCALGGFVAGLVNRRFSVVLLSIVAGFLSVAGWVVLPSLWVATAFLMVPAVHKDDSRAATKVQVLHLLPLRLERRTNGFATGSQPRRP